MRIGDEAYHELVAGSNFHIADLIKNFRFELITLFKPLPPIRNCKLILKSYLHTDIFQAFLCLT